MIPKINGSVIFVKRLGLMLIILLGATSCSLNQTSNRKSTLSLDQQAAMEKKILSMVNDYRRAQHLNPLIQSEQYAQISRAHCLEMQRSNDINHKGFSHRTALVRKQHPRALVAENVGFNYGYTTPEKHVVDSWVNSSGHRINIQGNYRYTGIGVTKSSEGKYYYSQLFVSP